MSEEALPERLNSGQNSSTVLAVDQRVSSWSSACGSPPLASRSPPPETRSQSISQSDRGSHSETPEQQAAIKNLRPKTSACLQANKRVPTVKLMMDS